MAKSILEQALLDVKKIEKQMAGNAKEILVNQIKPDIKRTVKESLEDLESGKPEEEIGAPAGNDIADVEMPEDTDADLTPDETGVPGAEEPQELPAPEDGEEGLEPEDETGMEGEEPDMEGEFGDEDELDLTGASDEEVIRVFKKMPMDGEIEVIKDGNKIELNDGDNQYIIELPGDEAISVPESIEESETIYEIEFEDEEPMDENASCETEDEEPIEEITRTRVQGRRQGLKPSSYPASHMRSGMRESKESEKLMRENSRLKDQLQNLNEKFDQYKADYYSLVKEKEQYVEGIKTIRTKMYDIATHNTNLTYITKLFTEHSTTLKEKKTIIERFDKASNPVESKNLYRTINAELKSGRKPVTETVKEVFNIDKPASQPKASTRSSINEAKVYEDPQTQRIKDLMKKL